MPRQKRSKWVHLAVVAAVCAGAAVTLAHAKRYMTPGFRTNETRPVQLAVLPPHAEFIKQKVVMTEQMIKECEALEAAAAAWIPQLLEAKGYTVKVVTQQEANENPELGEMVRRANERYDEEWGRLIRKPKKVHVGRYNAGEESQQLAARLDVDGLVLPRIQAVGVSGGKKALGMLLSLGQYMPQGYARLDLSIVDRTTGDIEAYFFFAQLAGMKKLTKKPDKLMATVAQHTLKKYPEHGEVLKPKGEVGEVEEDYSDEDESQLLGELEALLGPTEEEEAEPEPVEEVVAEPEAAAEELAESEAVGGSGPHAGGEPAHLA